MAAWVVPVPASRGLGGPHACPCGHQHACHRRSLRCFADAFRDLDLDRWAGSFLIVGAFTSALTSSDPRWWQSHFSALGTASDASGITFNFTLILTGVVLTALADFLTHDLTRWAEHTGEAHWKAVFVRVGFIVLGIMLGLVGVIPVNESLFWHNMVTYGAIGAFVGMLVAVPFLFRRLSGGSSASRSWSRP